jgi:hypothetical protein
MRFSAIADYMIARYGQVNQLPDPQDQELEEPETKPSIPAAEIEKVVKDKPPMSLKEIERAMKKAPTYEQIAEKKDDDVSLGAPISADRAKKWKDNLIRIYDSVKADLTKLPYFQDLYKEMGDDPLLQVFNQLIDAYIVNIAGADLKHAFMYGMKYLEGFNGFRTMVADEIKGRMAKERRPKQRKALKKRLYQLDDAIWRIQTRMWDKLKDVLNVHDIGFSPLITLDEDEKAEMAKVMKSIPHGTWKYDGTNKNIIRPRLARPVDPMTSEFNRIMKG